MDKLTDFKPIKRLALPELGELCCSGLIVIVGPNSSGKSQLLVDIRERISGEPRDLVVATDLEAETPDYKPLLKCLLAEGHIRSSWDDNDQEQLVPATTFLGTGRAARKVESQEPERLWNRSSQSGSRKGRNEYLGWCSAYLVTELFLRNRLVGLRTVDTIDFQNDPPITDLHALQLNEAACAALTVEIQRAFSKAIWPDSTRGNKLCLRIGEDGKVPTDKALRSFKEMAEYRTIETEGDGMKSYVATAISLLLGRRPVSVIDEPELCLHPPQAYAIGQFIGANATSEQTVTFVATHSSQVLRGVIQGADSLQIVRLTKSSKGFAARRVDSAALTKAMKKPTVRAETVLDGIFAQAVTIVEGDGDRIVYQATWETVGEKRNFDIHFTTVGGTGGIADTCRLYRILGIPVAVVADLDVITDTEKVRQILSSVCSDDSKTSDLMKKAIGIAETIRRLPPSISHEQATSELQELASQEFDWTRGDDRKLRESLSSLGRSLDGMRKLKSGGIHALPPEVAKPLSELVSSLRAVGFFLVPVGELEEWLSDCGIEASKKKKWAWANEAAEYIRTNPPRDDDIWQFISEVGDCLTEYLN